ncbi:MAG TPA: holo-[acyl-carrier-protein] synthase [Persephonella sp.]|uniref:Holo-[acyl-carrier-protein] synthase n=1 Tax=Persephonella marina (strain DSM 14350 / EX-H1) TaxID=123214 RepID=C0QR75_PERMH|nr:MULTISPECIES: holo-ACP synthase [Persephonella]ACO03057.1 holo-[acyl-carrier-protein] synthase [Persephonella marina EX-H1]HCB68918.1 holo-[acyl-carrier-protein] synthase [Persephonella sp.]
MRLYTGIDIVENKRIENALKRYGDTFLRKIFTEREIGYCKNKKMMIECFSARFAAKEAFIKAYYQAFGKKLKYKDIEITGKQGEPAEILLHPSFQDRESSLNPENISLSISHEKNYSVAIVIIYL